MCGHTVCMTVYGDSAFKATIFVSVLIYVCGRDNVNCALQERSEQGTPPPINAVDVEKVLVDVLKAYPKRKDAKVCNE